MAIARVLESVKARVVRLGEAAIVAKRIDRDADGPEIEIPYSEAFLSNKPVRAFQACVRCGDEVLRIGDEVHAVRRASGTWTRRPLLEKSRSEVEQGAVVYAHVAETPRHGDHWLRLTTESGLAARCSLELLEKYLAEKGIEPSAGSGSGSVFLEGRIRVGDPVAGFLRERKDSGSGPKFELDVNAYLRELDARPTVPGHRRGHGPATAAPEPGKPRAAAPREPATVAEVPCPADLGTVLLIDDDGDWREKACNWLRSGGATPVPLGWEQWDQARQEAERLAPKWILVDVFLKEGDRTWDGCKIARELASGEPPWSVILVTHLPDDAREKTGGRVPTHVIGFVPKSDSMRDLADALRGEYPPPAELAPVPAPASGVVGERRRSVKGTEKQIRHVVAAAERRLRAKVAVFSYDLFEDRARLVCGRSDLRREFAAYDSHMHKSQIRDLAFQGSADAWDVYPLGRRKGDTWFWLRKILPFEPGFAAGVRLDTPDRDEVWSLFAFWPPQPDSWGRLISRRHSNRTLHGLLRRAARIIEDARWHEHLEVEIERNRQEVQSARRSQNLAHEVRHEASHIKGNLEKLAGGLAGGEQQRAKFQTLLDECIQKCDHLHSVAETLLGTAKLSQGQHRLADVLDECTARNASECPDIGIPRARVVPEGLTVIGQKDLIITLLDNLLRNAAQAIRKTKSLRKTNTEGKYGEILVEAFRCKDEPGRLEILVHDTGLGISRLAAARMYDRGWSASGGTGLGMGICHDAVRRLGGRLEPKQTALFAGTTFRIVLPAGPLHQQG